MRSKIKEARESRGVKQGTLSQLMGVTQATVSNWESGRYVPNLEQCVMLCSVLRVKFEDLFDVSEMQFEGSLYEPKEQSATDLTDDEKKLLERFRACDDEGREVVLYTALVERRRVDDSPLIQKKAQ